MFRVDDIVIYTGNKTLVGEVDKLPADYINKHCEIKEIFKSDVHGFMYRVYFLYNKGELVIYPGEFVLAKPRKSHLPTWW